MITGSMFHMAAVIVVFASISDFKAARADDVGTNFFLKASKSVPRIGRRSLEDNYFMKASKSVPRIGRRDDPSKERTIDKKYFTEKYFSDNGLPMWGSIDGNLKELSSLMPYRELDQEPFREIEPESYPDNYWHQINKRVAIPEPQTQHQYQ